MILDAIAQEIRRLSIEEHKQLISLIVDSLTEQHEAQPLTKQSILDFAGAGAHLSNRELDAQEYINQLRAEWNHRP